MIEVFPNLYVGDQTDEIDVRGRIAAGQEWVIISAAKDPYHRAALQYKTLGAPKDHEEYLYAVRPRRLILNLVDAADPAYIRDEIVEITMQTINMGLSGGKVLIHCNQGQSRAPTLALLWMHSLAPSLAITKYSELNYDDAVELFRRTYPTYAPAKGMAEYARTHWEQQHVPA